jgi:hypothetical protein
MEVSGQIHDAAILSNGKDDFGFLGAHVFSLN